MENNERDRKLDQWLDEALSEYSSAEPRLGLEQRVLNRVRAEEQTRARKWNLWRWMPAFGAIAAVIIVAVAVRPMFQRKAPVREMNARIDTNSAPQEQKAQAPTPSVNEPASRSKTFVIPKAKSPQPPALADAERGNVQVRRQFKAEGGDRDRLIATGATQPGSLDSSLSDLKKAPVGAAGNLPLAANSSNIAPPPPPPPPQKPGSSEIDKGAIVTAQAAPASSAAKQLSSSAQTVEIQVPVAITEEKMTASESATVLLGKDAKRKEAHAKAEPASSRADANTMDVFGVKVRVQGGPATHQFPTPAPLSKQEKLALAAAQQLKDSTVTQHKSLDIAPLEIKDVDIKPLEGPEK